MQPFITSLCTEEVIAGAEKLDLDEHCLGMYMWSFIKSNSNDTNSIGTVMSLIVSFPKCPRNAGCFFITSFTLMIINKSIEECNLQPYEEEDDLGYSHSGEICNDPSCKRVVGQAGPPFKIWCTHINQWEPTYKTKLEDQRLFPLSFNCFQTGQENLSKFQNSHLKKKKKVDITLH